jgi:hypothetical protein
MDVDDSRLGCFCECRKALQPISEIGCIPASFYTYLSSLSSSFCTSPRNLPSLGRHIPPYPRPTGRVSFSVFFLAAA